MDVLNYQIYQTSKDASLLDPVVHQRMTLGSVEAYTHFINQKKSVSAVLIYADNTLYSQLLEVDGVKAVTMETPDEDLRKMDRKQGNSFPVYIISEEYGARGLDMRAPKSTTGITMLIGSAFVDQRTRI
jgi:hypothetical protein